MLDWLYKLFKGSSYKECEEILQNKLSTIPKDISEPVISFVECVRKNPKRFYADRFVPATVEYIDGHRGKTILQHTSPNAAYWIKDLKTSEGWRIGSLSSLWSLQEEYYFKSPNFLTKDEERYLIKEITEIMEYRVERLKKLTEIRASRRVRDERNRLKRIYCE